MKFLNFFLFLYVIFALLDPDPDSRSGSMLTWIRIRNTAYILGAQMSFWAQITTYILPPQKEGWADWPVGGSGSGDERSESAWNGEGGAGDHHGSVGATAARACTETRIKPSVFIKITRETVSVSTNNQHTSVAEPES
jgi:hypothetical protein